ncbi:MAG: ATP-grasp domain-containing protein, partial [Patescibacteria group bacterium]
MDRKIRVAVLRGGPSHEYDISLKTGRHVLSLLQDNSEVYEPRDVFISRSGEWFTHGVMRKPEDALLGTDVVWNALHGTYGEDGEVQSFLERLGLPFTGSFSEASELAMDKIRTKKVFAKNSFLVPRHEIVDDDVSQEQLLFIFRNFLHPVIIKPANGGSSIGTRIVHTFQELGGAIKHALQYSKKALVEEFIRGKEATCGVVENARGEKLYALLPIEIRKHPKKSFFDYEAKYSGETEEICPGNFSQKTSREIENQARKAHEVLG